MVTKLKEVWLPRACIVPAYCNYAYELISWMNSTPYTHALIYSCPCVPAICMYGHAHAHKPLKPRHHALIKRITIENEFFFSFKFNYYALSYCPCHVATLAPCPPTPPWFPPPCTPFAHVTPIFPHLLSLKFLLSYVWFREESLACSSL